jgi:hypothetical protein
MMVQHMVVVQHKHTLVPYQLNLVQSVVQLLLDGIMILQLVHVKLIPSMDVMEILIILQLNKIAKIIAE